MKKIVNFLTSLALCFQLFTVPIHAEGGSLAIEATTSLTFWLSSMGLRFFSESAQFGGNLWNLFNTFLISVKGFDSEKIAALEEKAKLQRYTYDDAGNQVLQIGSELYNLYSDFKTWLCEKFSIVSNSEDDKKIIFSDSDYVSCDFYESGSYVFYGNDSNFKGYPIHETGFYPVDSSTRPIFESATNSRISFYNFTVDGNFNKLVVTMAIETTHNSFSGGRFHASLGNFSTDDYWPGFSSYDKNGKHYIVYTTFFRDAVPTESVSGLKTFEGDFNAWGDFWYEATYGDSAYIPSGETWGKDLTASPSAVEKGALATIGQTFATGEELENWLKDILASSYPVTFPDAIVSRETIDVPSDIADGEITADWRTIFPFSLPYDYYLLCSLFVADPVTPEFNFKIFNQDFTFSLEMLDGVAELFRTGMVVIFTCGLIWGTKEIIK